MPSGLLAPTHGGRRTLLPHTLQNLYIEATPMGPTKDARFSRPGLYQEGEFGAGPIRLRFRWQNEYYVVSGDKLYKGGAIFATVSADNEVSVAQSFEQCVLTVDGTAYTVEAGGLDEIDDPDLPPVLKVLYLAGRFVYPVRGQDTFYWSAINDAATIDGLAFAAAESSSDEIMAAEVLGDALVFFGTRTTEWFYPTTDIAAPFQRSQGRKYDVGTPSVYGVSNHVLDNALWFVGDDRKVYRSGQVPERVSDVSIEFLLQGAGILNGLRVMTMTFNGHAWVLVSAENQFTLVYDVGQKKWYRWKSWEYNHLRVGNIDEEGMAGDWYTGKMMSFRQGLFTDIGSPLERVVSSYFPIRSSSTRVFNLTLRTTRGVGTSTPGDGFEPHVEMRCSDTEYGDFSVWQEAPLGVFGDRGDGAKAIWDGLGSFFAPGVLFEFRCSDPVDFTPYDVLINENRP